MSTKAGTLEAGTGPAEVFVQLLLRLNRPAEALAVRLGDCRVMMSDACLTPGDECGCLFRIPGREPRERRPTVDQTLRCAQPMGQL